MTPSPTLPASWQISGDSAPLQIEEVGFDGSDGEYIGLVNVSGAPLTLDGWLLGDAETPGDAEGLYALPADILAPGAIYLVARQAEAFHTRFGYWPNAAFEASNGPVQTLQRMRQLAHGNLALNDGGDEVVLLAPGLTLADAVAYGAGNYAALQLDGRLQPLSAYTLQRVPGGSYPTVRDVRQRFLLASARPLEARGLPPSALAPTAPLDEGMTAYWGSLGAYSSFTPGFSAPPHYVLAAAAAQGLHFVALADRGVAAAPIQLPPGMTLLPAWSWQGEEGAAIIYNGQPVSAETLNGLAGQLADRPGSVQWLGTSSPNLRSLAAFAVDDLQSEALPNLFDAWRQMDAPLLPAGNAQPDLPGAGTVNPRFTGLACRSQEPAALLEALTSARGWITSDRNTWLTLRAETASGDSFWMGSWLPAGNQVTLHIAYGDHDGEAAGLALWQNGAPLQELINPPVDGRWSLALPALPGALLAVVATQADGDFAVTAPLQVVQPPPSTVLINEVLPAPETDLNGDGESDSQDEFIELWNPGAEPVALAGWQLVDRQGEAEGGHRFTFKEGRLILGGQRLLLWRAETRLSLDNAGDRLRLLDRGSNERDVISWDLDFAGGCALARVTDGGGWAGATNPTPGEANRATACGEAGTRSSSPSGGLIPTPTREPTFGQAGGPPGSIAQAKLAGLKAWVEMQGVITAPPGLFTRRLYVADITADGRTAGIGVAVYLSRGEFPLLVEGDLVHLRGRWDSYRGEMELVLAGPEQIWKITNGTRLHPLSLPPAAVREWVEGRLVTVRGVVTGWQGDSIFLGDPDNPSAEPVRVTVYSSLRWKRPFVYRGEIWQVTGIVSQYAAKSPWSGGYRLLVRYPYDFACLNSPP